MRPGDQVVVGLLELATAAEHPRTDADTRSLALRALRYFYRVGETSMGGAVEREQLLRTYGRRLKRKAEISSFPLGTEELVRRLTAEETADPVVVVARETDDGAVYFFCDESLTWMIGCVAALPGLGPQP
jgi:hypothetical protein